MKNKYTVAELFAGAGGLSKAFQEAGAEIIWANDSDSNVMKIYRENFACVRLNVGDIRDIKVKEIPDLDILIGGFPCQPFSVAGRERSFNKERETFFLDIIRILNQKEPKAFFLENVKKLKSVDNGRVYEMIIKSLEAEGYFIKDAVLNDSEYGDVPYNKERLYIVGFKDIEQYKQFEFPSKVQLTKKIYDIIDFDGIKDKKYYSDKSIDLLQRIQGETIKKGITYQIKYSGNNKDQVNIKELEICPATLNNSNISLIKDSFGIRKLIPEEYFYFQGFTNIKIPEKIDEHKLYQYASQCSTVIVVKRIAENILTALNYSIQRVEEESSTEERSNYSLSEEKHQEETYSIVSNNEQIESINESEKNTPITNEEEFTLYKVIPALKNKGFYDVRYNHGIDEYGKDVTYKYEDNFGNIKYGASQVKYEDISGGASREIDIILSQIEDAFEMPYIDVKENREIYINQLLIICSGRYTKNAKEKIFKKSKKGYNVIFLDGQDIDNLLDK